MLHELKKNLVTTERIQNCTSIVRLSTDRNAQIIKASPQGFKAGLPGRRMNQQTPFKVPEILSQKLGVVVHTFNPTLAC